DQSAVIQLYSQQVRLVEGSVGHQRVTDLSLPCTEVVTAIADEIARRAVRHAGIRCPQPPRRRIEKDGYVRRVQPAVPLAALQWVLWVVGGAVAETPWHPPGQRPADAAAAVADHQVLRRQAAVMRYGDGFIDIGCGG